VQIQFRKIHNTQGSDVVTMVETIFTCNYMYIGKKSSKHLLQN
jgi:hypothetical protein